MLDVPGMLSGMPGNAWCPRWCPRNAEVGFARGEWKTGVSRAEARTRSLLFGLKECSTVVFLVSSHATLWGSAEGASQI